MTYVIMFYTNKRGVDILFYQKITIFASHQFDSSVRFHPYFENDEYCCRKIDILQKKYSRALDEIFFVL